MTVLTLTGLIGSFDPTDGGGGIAAIAWPGGGISDSGAANAAAIAATIGGLGGSPSLVSGAAGTGVSAI